MIKANEVGISNESIWFDPIVTPASNVDTNQVGPCLEFMSQLAEIAPECKSTVGLSNISSGTPQQLRPYLNRTYLIMLMKYGLYSAIVDAFDAMITKRPYRRAKSIDQAIKEINKNSGTQFDPKVVKAFLKVIKKTKQIKKVG